MKKAEISEAATRRRFQRASEKFNAKAVSGPNFDQMKKIRQKAAVADNPYSNMGKGQRTRARNELASAEKAIRKRDKSTRTLFKARSMYEGVTGYTASGRPRFAPGSIGAKRRRR